MPSTPNPVFTPTSVAIYHHLVFVCWDCIAETALLARRRSSPFSHPHKDKQRPAPGRWDGLAGLNFPSLSHLPFVSDTACATQLNSGGGSRSNGVPLFSYPSLHSPAISVSGSEGCCWLLPIGLSSHTALIQIPPHSPSRRPPVHWLVDENSHPWVLISPHSIPLIHTHNPTCSSPSNLSKA